MQQHLTSIAHLFAQDIHQIIDRGVEYQRAIRPYEKILRDRVIGLWFRETSTRTKTAFAVAAVHLGANIIDYRSNELQLETGETLDDTARILDGFLDAIVIRNLDRQFSFESFLRQKQMSVVNALGDDEHPTQALCDLTTVQSHFGTLKGVRILYLGQARNAANALALLASKLKCFHLTICSPPGYGLNQAVRTATDSFIEKGESVIKYCEDPAYLHEKFDVVYTERWLAMGTTRLEANWREIFSPFRVTEDLFFRLTDGDSAVFMHDLPAHRGDEVSSVVIDGPRSIVFDQARMKLFSAMAVLEWCLLGQKKEV